jgi:cytoskeleton protein RodZ
MEIETTMTSDKTPSGMHANNALKKQAGIGKRLKTARESLRLSEKEAAARLHLSLKMIPIMENEDFDNGPPATFMRGYLRSYARMLNISDNEVNTAISQLEASIPRSPEPCAPPILQTRPTHASHRYLRGMTYIVVPVLALLVCIWWTSHSKDLMSAIKPVAATLTNTVDPSVTTPVVTTTANKPTTNSIPAAPVPPVVATPAANPPAPAAATVTPDQQAKPSNDATADMDMAQPDEPGLEQSDGIEERDNRKNIASENDNNVN